MGKHQTSMLVELLMMANLQHAQAPQVPSCQRACLVAINRTPRQLLETMMGLALFRHCWPQHATALWDGETMKRHSHDMSSLKWLRHCSNFSTQKIRSHFLDWLVKSWICLLPLSLRSLVHMVAKGL